jgi:hypothetical protein
MHKFILAMTSILVTLAVAAVAFGIYLLFIVIDIFVKILEVLSEGGIV